MFHNVDPVIDTTEVVRSRTNTQITYHKENEAENEDDYKCGFMGWKPKCMQIFANANAFVVLFSILGILQGAMFTYMIGIISTLEKRFAFETKVSGFILIADNLSAMVLGPIVGYLGSKYNRSILIGVGETVVALAALVNTIPYFLYGPGTHLLSTVVSGTNQTSYHFCGDKEDIEGCGTGSQSTMLFPVIVLWLSSFFNGLGYTAFYTIGLTYVDDNIKKNNSAIYLSKIALIFTVYLIQLNFSRFNLHCPFIRSNIRFCVVCNLFEILRKSIRQVKILLKLLLSLNLDVNESQSIFSSSYL